jgi:LEA14-like dessication related protein
MSACTPTVKPVGMDVDALTWNQVDAHVDLRAENPWPIDLTVVAVDYTVRVGGDVVASGTITEPQTIPARGQLRTPLPVSIDTRSALEALTEPTEDATTGTVLSGTVTIDTPLGPQTIPIEMGREIPVLEEPRLRRPWTRVEQLDLARGTVDLVVGCKVVNPNGLTLSARKVDYGVSLSGIPVVEGQKPHLELEANGTSTVELPVHLDVSAIGRGLMKALESGRISGAVWLDGMVQTPWDPIRLDLRRSGAIEVWE